jgi:hypothetical protein
LQRTNANYLCVRKYLYDQCVEHGVLARHIAFNVDFAAEMVFVPAAWELRQAAVQGDKLVKHRCAVEGALGGCHSSAT